MKKFATSFLFLVVLLTLVSCTTATAVTERQTLYLEVYDGVFYTVLFLGLLVGLLAGFLSLANQKWSTAGIVLLGTLACHFIFAFPMASNQAEHATTVAWEDAIDDQATYDQKIHGFWVKYEEVRHECSFSFISASATNCVYVTESCTTDDEGDEDCDYTPYFDYERDLYAVFFDGWQNPNIKFNSKRLAPENWEQEKYSFGSIIGRRPGRDFLYENHPDWVRVRQAIDAGLVLPASRVSKDFNWIHANDMDLFEEYAGRIPTFEQAGLLPVISPLHHSFDYDVVQFSQKAMPAQEQQEHWQKQARLWVGLAGQEVQASLILYFALESEVTDMNAWLNASKAYLQQESVFGKQILPKNLVLVLCTVDESMQQVSRCMLETGMFQGNNLLKDKVKMSSAFPFTPEGFFGVVTAQFDKDGGNFIKDENGWLVPVVETEGGTIGKLILENFQRVSMEESKYLRTTITPTQEQQDAIWRSAIWYVVKLLGAVYIVAFGLWMKSTQTSGKK